MIRKVSVAPPLKIELVRREPRSDALPLEFRDEHGRVVAHGAISPSESFLLFPGFGRFRFRRRGPVVAYLERGVTERAARELFERSVLPLVLQARGREAMHASGVLGPSGVVAFLAAAGTGKSTLAWSLAHRGFPLWADDAVVWSPRTLRALRLPLVSRVTSEVRALFAGRAEPVRANSAQAPLAALCLLRRDEVWLPEIRQVAGARRLSAVLPNALVFHPGDSPVPARTVAAYLDLLAKIPVLELRFSPTLNGLERLLDVVTRDVLRRR